MCPSFRTCQDLWKNGHTPLGPCQPSSHLEMLLGTGFSLAPVGVLEFSWATSARRPLNARRLGLFHPGQECSGDTSWERKGYPCPSPRPRMVWLCWKNQLHGIGRLEKPAGSRSSSSGTLSSHNVTATQEPDVSSGPPHGRGEDHELRKGWACISIGTEDGTRSGSTSRQAAARTASRGEGVRARTLCG